MLNFARPKQGEYKVAGDNDDKDAVESLQLQALAAREEWAQSMECGAMEREDTRQVRWLGMHATTSETGGAYGGARLCEDGAKEKRLSLKVRFRASWRTRQPPCI